MRLDSKLRLAIAVNGNAVTTGAETLADLVAELGFVDQRVATARNGDFVAATARVTTKLCDGDAIEIVSPRHGG